MYIIRRTNDQKMVARSGSEHSYTNKIEHAEIFATRDTAQRQLCVENEYIERLTPTR